MTIEELAGRTFASRNTAHLVHWQTKSYAQHVALGGFYDAVIEAIDALIENYQGMYGLIGDVEIPAAKIPKDIAKFLSDEADEIEASRAEITQGSDSLGALVDDLVSVYTRCVFLLGMK